MREFLQDDRCPSYYPKRHAGFGVGTLKDQENPDFCLPPSEIPPAGALGQGYCPGQDRSGDDEGGNYTGGRWFFTINGQQFPTIPATAAGGEIWRITNASASITYDLRL